MEHKREHVMSDFHALFHEITMNRTEAFKLQKWHESVIKIIQMNQYFNISFEAYTFFCDEQVEILVNFHWTFSFQQAFNCCNRFEFNQIHDSDS